VEERYPELTFSCDYNNSTQSKVSIKVIAIDAAGNGGGYQFKSLNKGSGKFMTSIPIGWILIDKQGKPTSPGVEAQVVSKIGDVRSIKIEVSRKNSTNGIEEMLGKNELPYSCTHNALDVIKSKKSPTVYLPTTAAHFQLDFKQSGGVAKSNLKNRSVSVIAPSLKRQDVPVTYFVSDPNDNTKLVEEVTTYALSSFSAPQRYEIAAESVVAWTIDGKLLDSNAVLEGLKTPKHVLLVPPQFEYSNENVLEPYFRAFLNPYLIVLRLPAVTGKPK
jgi:hypothetical protein